MFYQGRRTSEFWKWSIVLAGSLFIGLSSVNPKISILITGLLFAALLYYRFGSHIFIYLSALFWWFPLDVGRLIPFASALGDFGIRITAPEVLVYLGTVFVILLRPNAVVSFFKDWVWFFLLLLVFGGLLAANRIETTAGAVMFRRSTFFFAAIIFLYRTLLTNQHQIKRILNLMLVGTVFLELYILMAHFVVRGLFITAGHYEGQSRLGGVYLLPVAGSLSFGPNIIGLITAVLATIFLFTSIQSTSRRKNTLSMLGFFLNVLMLASTGSRAGIASLLIAGFAFGIYFLLIRGKGKVLVYGVLLLFAVLFILPQVVPETVLNRFQAVFVGTNDPYGSMPTRLRLYEDAWKLFQDNPFGIGYGIFVTLHDNYILWEQNLFLNTVMGGGFLGLIGLVGFFVLFYLRGFRKLKNTVALVLLAGVSTFFINALFTDPNIGSVVYFCWILLALGYATVSIKENNSTSQKMIRTV